MKRFAALAVALALPTSLVACATSPAEDVTISDPDQLVDEIDAALEVGDESTDVGATVAVCITDLAFCLSEGADTCKADFRECMPKFGKKHAGKKGAKFPKADALGADLDEGADAVDEAAAAKPGPKPGQGDAPEGAPEQGADGEADGGPNGPPAAPQGDEDTDSDFAGAPQGGPDADGASSNGPSLGQGGFRACLRDLHDCVLVDGVEPAVCADEAVACVQAAAEAHKEKMCTKGLERCAEEDAPAEKCAKIEERCAE